MDNKKSVKFGIIGVGNMGYAHLKAITAGKVEGAQITALCDIDPNRREVLQEEFPSLPMFASHTQLMESGLCDAVIIATPHRFHAAIAMDALSYHLHVLTEKPEDISVGVAQKLNETAEKSGLVFGIMFNQRTNPLFQKAREIVQSGQLGQPKRLVWIITNWYRTQAYYDSGSWRATWSGEGGGVLLNQAPHNLDIWQWIFGMPDEIYAICDRAKYHNIEVEDDVTILANYKNGSRATFITTTGEYPGTNRLEISGDLGKLVLENGKLCHWKLAQSEREYCFSAKPKQEPIAVEYEEYIPDRPETAHCGILRNFCDAILTGAPLLAPGYEGIRELTISNAAYLSAWKNQSISLPFEAIEFDRFLSQLQKTSKGYKADTVRESDGEYKNRWKVNW